LWEQELLYLNSLKSRRKPKGLTVVPASSASSSKVTQDRTKKSENLTPLVVVASSSFSKKDIIPADEIVPQISMPPSPIIFSGAVLPGEEIVSDLDQGSQEKCTNLSFSSQRTQHKRAHSSRSSSSSFSGFNFSPLVDSDEDMFPSGDEEPLFKLTNQQTQDKIELSCPKSSLRKDELLEQNSPTSSLTPRSRERKKAIQKKLSKFKRARRIEDD